MSRHISALATVVRGQPVRAIGAAMGRAVALTDTELVTVRARMFRTYIDRFRLGTLVGVRAIPNPRACFLLEVEFERPAPTTVTLLFGPREVADFELITTLLRRRLGIASRGQLLALATPARRQGLAAADGTHPNRARGRSLTLRRRHSRQNAEGPSQLLQREGKR